MYAVLYTIRHKSPACVLALTAVLAMSSGSSSAQTVIIAPTAPPHPRVEVVPVAPSGRVWDSGHWRWNGRRNVWASGHSRPGIAGARWIPGSWGPRGHGYGWTEGRWAR